MGVEPINIKNKTYYFYNDIIDLKEFDSKLLKIDKKHYKRIKKIDDYESIYSVNSLYLRVNHASGYIEEKNGSVDKNK